jgi:hypothetical protein
VAVLEISPASGQATVCGLGNVAAWLDDGRKRRGMICMPGIAGHQAASIRQHSYDISEETVLVVHSDGLSDKWKLSDYPGLRQRSPAVIVAALLRDAGVHRDDSCVVVVRPAVLGAR